MAFWLPRFGFHGVGIGADDTACTNAQLCLKFLRRLCLEENLCWLDPSHDVKHWAKLTTSDLVVRVNDDQSDPSWKLLQLLARSSKV